jgi:hypothetical protein
MGFPKQVMADLRAANSWQTTGAPVTLKILLVKTAMKQQPRKHQYPGCSENWKHETIGDFN